MRTVPFVMVLALAAPALAQGAKGGKLARDDWWITWTGATKAAWGHDRLEETADGFVLVRRSWTLTGTDALVERETRTETDLNGEVRRETFRERGPYGPIEATTQADATGLAWEVKVRALAAIKGRIDGRVSDPAVVALRTLRGFQPMNKRLLRVLVVPGKAVEEVDFEVAKEQSGWVARSPKLTSWYDASGGLVRRSRSTQRYPDEITLRVASEGKAKDKAAKPPAAALAPVEMAAEGGARVRRPAGRGWVLLHGVSTQQPQVGLDHPSGLYCLAISLPWRTPTDPKRLLRFANDLKGMVDRGADGKDSFTLAAPRAATWRGRPSVRFDVGGFLAMAPITGEAHLVGVEGGRTFLAFTAVPADLAERCKKEFDAAAAALELVPDAPEVWQRLELQGGSIELPRDWIVTSDPAVGISGLGVSNVGLGQQARPARMDLRRSMLEWVRNRERDPQYEGLKLVADDTTTIDGREARRLEFTATIKDADGLGATVRGLICLVEVEGQLYDLALEVRDSEFDLAAVDRALQSVRLGKKR